MALIERWRRWRDSLLRSARFRRHAASFPLTRPIARRQARAAFDLCAGFVYSQVLAACIELELLDRLARGPRSVADLAAELDLAPAAAERLLRAAAALGLLQARPPGYGLGPLGAAIAGDAGIAAMIRHHRMLYTDLADPVALLRGQRPGTQLADYWAYAGGAPAGQLPGERIAAYTALMGASQPAVAAEVLDAYPVHRHRRLLDVGGGDGTFLAAVAERCPRLELVLLDLPAVAERARARLSAAGLAQRIEVIGRDFTAEPLPTGADLVSLVRIAHDHDDPVVLQLFRRIREALPPGGTLLIAEPLAGAPGAERVGDAYFGFYLLAMGQGRPRRVAELEQLLRLGGFSDVRERRTHLPLLTGLVVARTPSQPVGST